jgi:hypothetical protein
MNSTKRRIATLITALGVVGAAGGISAALASGSPTPSSSISPSSISPSVSDDGTADQGLGDVPAGNQGQVSDDGTADQGPGDQGQVGDDGTADQGPGDVPAEHGEDQDDDAGNVGEDDNSGSDHGHAED